MAGTQTLMTERITLSQESGSIEATSTSFSWASAFVLNYNYRELQTDFFSKDWSVGAGTPNYLTARNRVSSTGAFLAAFLDWLHQNDLLDYSQVSIVGFSLGGKSSFP